MTKSKHHRKTTVSQVAAAVSVLLALTGCASNAEWLGAQNSIVPSSWQTVAVDIGVTQSGQDIQWWKAWNNQELDDLLQLADAANTDILTARANLRSAAALADDATAALFPTLGLSAQGSGSRKNNVDSESYQALGTYKWSVSLAGGNIAAQRAADYEAMAEAMTLEDTRITVAGEVARNYVGLALAYVKKSIARMTLENYRQAYDIARWNYQAGLSDSTEVEQAVSNMESAAAAIPLADLAVEQYRNALARLTGQSSATLKLKEMTQVPQAPMTLAVTVPAKTLQNRPDMRSAYLNLAAASDRVYEARSQWFPTINISGNLGTQAATIAALGASGTGVASLIGALSMPLLNWGEQVTATEQQLANLDRVRAQYSATLLGALEETENALTQISVSERRESALKAALTSAESAAESAMQQYRAGLTDYQTVLNTQRGLLSARENWQSNKADMATGLIDLYRAMGGGWQVPENLPGPEFAQTEQ